VPNKTIEIRLDKLDDAYGSPGLEDIERFSRALAEVGVGWYVCREAHAAQAEMFCQVGMWGQSAAMHQYH
jgi:hypothetical protein